MKKTKLLYTTALLFLIIAAVLTSCAEKYQLTISGESGGSVTLSPEGGSYKEGETVTLTATPDEGYSFTGWGGISDISVDYSTSREIEIIMPAVNVEVTSVFSQENEGWLFMVYMAGDNSLSSAVNYDINEMEEGLYEAVEAGNSSIDTDVRVLVLADYSGFSSNTKLYLIEPDGNDLYLSPVELSAEFNSSGELNMGAPDTLENFISYGLATFPSTYTSLVLWNHGGGVKSIDSSDITSREICEDDSSDDILYMNEVQTAVSAAIGIEKLDIIGMDACIMGEVETAYEMRDLGDYFVASAASEWGDGWAYENIFDDFYSEGNPPEPAEMADILVEQFYESTYQVATGWPNTLAAVETSKLDALKTEIDELAGMIHLYGTGDASQEEFQSLRDNSVLYYTPRPNGMIFVDGCYDDPENNNYNNDDTYEYYILSSPYYDLYSFCLEIKNSSVYDQAIEDQVDLVLNALNAAIVASYGDSSDYDSDYSGVRNALGLDYYSTVDTNADRGLSIFIPHGELTWKYSTTSGGTIVLSHYANHGWYYSELVDGYYSPGGIDFCTSDSDDDADGTVETWRELFEAWYDAEGTY